MPNAFEACVFTFGICQAGGAGKVLAEWVTEGETEWDMWSCDPRRYTSFAADKDYCVAKGMEISDPANDEKEWIEKATAAVWPKFYKSIGGKEKLDHAQKALGR